MGMLDRIKKKQFAGLKEFVQNMEITGPQKRQQIFTAGVLEDPIFMSWVMKNIKTFDDFVELPSDELESILAYQEQVLPVFAKAISPLPPEKVASLQSSVGRFASRIKDELSFIKEATPAEIESARYFLLKLSRKLQFDESIFGFPWQLPQPDIFYPKAHKDGVGEIKFETGILAARGEYIRNRRVGLWKHYYETGRLLAEGEYSDGLKNGMWKFYYGNGLPKSQGKYLSDLRHGVWNEWDRNGVVTESNYQEGVKL